MTMNDIENEMRILPSNVPWCSLDILLSDKSNWLRFFRINKASEGTSVNWLRTKFKRNKSLDKN